MLLSRDYENVLNPKCNKKSVIISIKLSVPLYQLTGEAQTTLNKVGVAEEEYIYLMLCKLGFNTGVLNHWIVDIQPTPSQVFLHCKM